MWQTCCMISGGHGATRWKNSTHNTPCTIGKMAVRQMNGKSKSYESLFIPKMLWWHITTKYESVLLKCFENIARIKCEAIEWDKGRRKGPSVDTHSERSLTVHTNYIIEWYIKYTELNNKYTECGSRTKRREKNNCNDMKK